MHVQRGYAFFSAKDKEWYLEQRTLVNIQFNPIQVHVFIISSISTWTREREKERKKEFGGGPLKEGQRGNWKALKRDSIFFILSLPYLFLSLSLSLSPLSLFLDQAIKFLLSTHTYFSAELQNQFHFLYYNLIQVFFYSNCV